MKIAICDDDKQTLELISVIVEDYMQLRDIQLQDLHLL